MFFKEEDIEQAMDHWNMVQANLRRLASFQSGSPSTRQVSNQLSGSFFLTAATCFASILLLAEQILRQPESAQDFRQALLWTLGCTASREARGRARNCQITAIPKHS